ncbi:cytochrome c oxidase accessory protein CcoG [Myxococcota bacterium]|nr:cytochrome c oxidase accessory protein CcoG [Myxococcota bacterium]MBU1898934.1 cytochrome c oxidase accessory protein CcoG [Myxococcota bacterium]
MPLAENDTVSTIGEHGRRVWLYPYRAVGAWLKRRNFFAALLLLMIFGLPFLTVNGNPAIRFDVIGRRFYIFGRIFFASDANYLMFLFGIFIFAIFFFTALLGRVWCGWACPQTVLLDLIIRPIEEFIEGKPRTRKKLDESPWTGDKIIKKSIKFAVYVAVAAGFSGGFMAFFVGWGGLNGDHPVALVFFLSITAFLIFDFSWFREQTCIVVCPYGRFQSVLLDNHSIGVAYDSQRGEPRGRPKDEGVGDCIDCEKCVRVCPTGVDIRKGAQMECVHCTACIDACDSVMIALKKPTGLIRYSSEAELAGEKTQWLRPRVIVYAVGLVLLSIALVTAMATRQESELILASMPGSTPWIVLPDGRIQNTARLRISNKGGVAQSFTLEVVDPIDGEIFCPFPTLEVQPSEVKHFPLLLKRTPPKQRRTPFLIRVKEGDKPLEILQWDFLYHD